MRGFIFDLILYFRYYLGSSAVIVFVLTVAAVLSIKKILIESIDSPSVYKIKVDKNKTHGVIEYLKYSFRNINKERLTYAEWQQTQQDSHSLC